MAIASVTIKCSKCGKEFEHRRKRYNRSDANDYEAWAAENITLCPDCYRKQKRAAEEAHDKELTKDIDFAPLTGSEKQIAWAEKIRTHALARLYEIYDGDIDPEIVELLTRTIVDSRWWIDNREEVDYDYRLKIALKKYLIKKMEEGEK